MNGVLIIDKPAGLTSHDVVNRVRRVLGQRSVGHLGTLDPLATGVLPLVTGGMTRLAQFYTTSEKVYEGVVRFGFATDTYDAEGEPTSPPKSVALDAAEVDALAASFRGVIEQMPPPFSAKKIHGVPAYKLARKQKEVILKPVKVEIKNLEILNISRDRVTLRARVTSGTYMRSLAHDMGQQLGCGAHLESLRRTAIAEFEIADAHTLQQLEKYCHPDRSFAFPKGKGSGVESLPRATPRNEGGRGGPGVAPASNSGDFSIEDLFVHPRKLLPQMPSVTADEANAARIRNGRTVNLPELSRSPQVKVFYGQKELIAIATRVAGTLFHPTIVLVSEPASSPSTLSS